MKSVPSSASLALNRSEPNMSEGFEDSTSPGDFRYTFPELVKVYFPLLLTKQKETILERYSAGVQFTLSPTRGGGGDLYYCA